MAKLTGGGIQSSKRVEVGVRGGKPTTNVISPRGVSEYGYATPGKMRQGAHSGVNTSQLVKTGTASQVPSGNAVAASTVCGVGGSRTIYKSGGQGIHGAPVQGSTPAPKDILSEYGPETTDGSAMRRSR
jgi:hypothetical protein